MAATAMRSPLPSTPPHLSHHANNNSGVFDDAVPPTTRSGSDYQPRFSSYLDLGSNDLANTSSPSQAKRAIEAHLQETDRRLQETQALGQTLLKQREDWTSRLDEVERHQDDAQIPTHLRQQLVEIEKEHADVGREVARALIAPKARSEDVQESNIFASHATASPTKVSAPSRRSRNQPSTRAGDLQFAADISTSLLAQVRQLQAAVAERDETIRKSHAERENVDRDLLFHTQKVRVLSDSEQKYKDENWNLETIKHELETEAKEANDREKKLNSNLVTLTTERNKLQNELDDLKHAHGTLTDEHVAIRRTHDTETHGLRRDLDTADTERQALQTKIDDLFAQNQELAKAVHARSRSQHLERLNDADLAGSENLDPTHTPEDSPPPSPTKATPRHGPLEAETLKSSLMHAHRTIQNLKSNIHREKTEKIELKRMLHEAREDLDQQRRGSDTVATSKRPKSKALDTFKKPARPDMLGATRRPRTDVDFVDEDDWEESHADAPSQQQRSSSRIRVGKAGHGLTDHSDAYQTANETETFDTADERHTTTESEAFMTGAESMAGDSTDELTETEGTIPPHPRHTSTGRVPRSSLTSRQAGDRTSYLSTASTSADEADHLQTPVQQQPPYNKFKLRNGRQPSSLQARFAQENTPEGSRSFLTDSRDSPATVIADQSPAGAGEQSLFAELGGMSEINSRETTPARSTIASEESSTPDASFTPSRTAAAAGGTVSVPKSAMVSTGMMTDPWQPAVAAPLVPGVTTSATESTPQLKALVGHSDPTIAPVTPANVATHDADNAAAASLMPSAAQMESLRTRDVSKHLASEHAAPSSATAENARPSDSASAAALTTALVTAQLSAPVDQAHSSKLLPSAQIDPPLTPPRRTDIGTQYTPGRDSNSNDSHKRDTAITPIVIPKPTQTSTVGLRQPLGSEHKLTEGGQPAHGFSGLLMQESEPVTATRTKPEPITTDRTFSPIWTQTVQPVTPTRTWAAKATKTPEREVPPVLKQSLVAGTKPAGPQIYEDETRELPRDTNRTVDTAASPLKNISGNAVIADQGSTKRMRVHNDVTSGDQAPQAIATGMEPEDLKTGRNQIISTNVPSMSHAAGQLSTPTSPTRYPARNSSRPRDIMPIAEGNDHELPSTYSTRPSSASSNRAPSVTFQQHPPLPPDHKDVIARVASQKLSPSKEVGSTTRPGGIMGPPLLPASAMRRSRTPNESVRSPTRSSRHSVTGKERETMGSRVSRRSSVSSFASEVDERFQLKPEHANVGNTFDTAAPGTDPRMIQAITQTMIGEFLWKYTRKAGGKTMSSTRHRRYFWVHPYTKTLYWSERDPQSAGASELKAKSVAIESVRVVSDDNPMPPGLHRESLEVTTPGRKVRFTASTSARHEVWVSALNYLLHRDAAMDDNNNNSSSYAPNGNAITNDDLNEFSVNGYGAHLVPNHHRMSMSSYNSRGNHGTAHRTRQSLPANVALASTNSRVGNSHVSHSGSVVSHQDTVRPGRSETSQIADKDRTLRAGSVSRMQRAFGSITGKNRSDTGVDRHENNNGVSGTYDASTGGIRNVDAETGSSEYPATKPGLEDVRACCDGKHNVGDLDHHHHHSNGPAQARISNAINRSMSRRV